jgi:hypothetical protein
MEAVFAAVLLGERAAQGLVAADARFFVFGDVFVYHF